MQPKGQGNQKPDSAQNTWLACVIAATGGLVNVAVVAAGAGGRSGAMLTVSVTCIATLAAVIAAGRRANVRGAATRDVAVTLRAKTHAISALATEPSGPYEEPVASGQAREAIALREARAILVSPPAKEAKRMAEQANGAMAEFLLGLSRELRTSLNALAAVVDLLADTQLDETQRIYLDVFRTSSQSLMDLVSEAADVAAIESGRLELQCEDFDLQSLLNEVVLVISPLTEQNKVVVTARVDERIAGQIHGDPIRIRQALVNLLRNAMKPSERGAGIVRMSASMEDNDPARSPRMLRFDVTDTRAGTPSEESGKIHSYLAGGNKPTGWSFGGQGSELMISKRLAEAMSGGLRVSAVPGGGTTFSLIVPIAPAKGQSTMAGRGGGKAADTASGSPLSGSRLLLVAARDAERMHLDEELSAAGCSVTAVDGAMPALLTLAHAVEMKEPFRLVVIDGRLSRVTGIETAQRVAAQEWADNPGIVVLIGGLTEDDLEGREEVKARLYAGDPFDLASLALELAAAASESGACIAERVRRVLVVDDNSTNLFLVKDYLKRLPGFEVEAVDGGEIAVERATNASFDLILMDMQMPVVDGRAATRRIRQFEREHGLPEIPIIAFTAHSLEIELAEATAAGCNGHLMKPAKKQKVIDTVLSYLQIPLTGTGGDRVPQQAPTLNLPIWALGQEQFRDHTGDYLARLAESLTQAEMALKAHDFNTVKDISHKWIGPGVGLGLPEISDEGGLLQDAARLSNEPAVEAQLARIRDYTNRLQVVFKNGATVRARAQ
jgi:two-component system, sensor histidine kinase and response regulator